MKKIIIILLSALMILSFAACSESSEGSGFDYFSQINGTWQTGEVDISEQLNEYINASDAFTDEEKAEFLKIDRFTVGLIISFDADKNFSLKYDDSITEKSIEYIVTSWNARYRNSIQSRIDEKGLGITVDEYINSYRPYFEDIDFSDTVEIFQKMALELVDGIGVKGEIASGTYNIIDGKLYFKDEKTSLTVYGDYYTYSVEGTELNINNFYYADGRYEEEALRIGMLELPVTFKKDSVIVK